MEKISTRNIVIDLRNYESVLTFMSDVYESRLSSDEADGLSKF